MKEAATLKAMGALVQAKTLKFDMSSMLRVSGLGGSIDAGGGPPFRPGSAMVGGGGGGGGGGGDAAAQMRLSSLVKELQEQVHAQGRQLREHTADKERLVQEACEERELQLKQEQAMKVRAPFGLVLVGENLPSCLSYLALAVAETKKKLNCHCLAMTSRRKLRSCGVCWGASTRRWPHCRLSWRRWACGCARRKGTTAATMRR